MVRAAFRLSVIIIAVCCLQPSGHAQDNSLADETATRGVAEEFFAAYATEDLDRLMGLGLWSLQSPELTSRRKTMQALFAANHNIKVQI